jgi:hypothetical protein
MLVPNEWQYPEISKSGFVLCLAPKTYRTAETTGHSRQ